MSQNDKPPFSQLWDRPLLVTFIAAYLAFSGIMIENLLGKMQTDIVRSQTLMLEVIENVDRIALWPSPSRPDDVQTKHIEYYAAARISLLRLSDLSNVIDIDRRFLDRLDTFLEGTVENVAAGYPASVCPIPDGLMTRPVARQSPHACLKAEFAKLRSEAVDTKMPNRLHLLAWSGQNMLSVLPVAIVVCLLLLAFILAGLRWRSIRTLVARGPAAEIVDSSVDAASHSSSSDSDTGKMDPPSHPPQDSRPGVQSPREPH